MSFSVRSTHLEALRDGRMVEPGESVPDSVAKENPELVERGVLIEDAKPPEAQKHTKKPEPKDGHKPAAAPQKEDSK